jgi:hypothetical protein
LPQPIDIPDKVRAYVQLGVSLEDAGSQWNGDCPFCGKEAKFTVETETGFYRCWSCQRGGAKGGGNHLTFIRHFHEDAFSASQDYSELLEDRGFLEEETLSAFGVCKSPLTGEWLVPGYDHEKRLMSLWRFIPDTKTGKRRLQTPKGIPQSMVGPPMFDPDCEIVFVLEGQWDAMIMYETLRFAKKGPGGSLVRTSNVAQSLFANANVIGVPGANTFKPEWCDLLAGKHVILCYDSDLPTVNEKTGRANPPAGMSGAKRVAEMLVLASEPPTKIEWIRWGADGYDPELKSGYDVRDLLNA